MVASVALRAARNGQHDVIAKCCDAWELVARFCDCRILNAPGLKA